MPPIKAAILFFSPGLLQGADHNLSVDTGIALVHRLQDIPGCVLRVGAGEHLVDRHLILVHFSRLRQSSSVIFQRFSGVFSRAWKRWSWVSLSICTQNFSTTAPAVGELPLKLVDLVVGPLPVLQGAEASSRSTITRPYQLRSKMAMCPVLGSFLQKRHR